MQATWFPRHVAFCGSRSECKCIIARPATLCGAAGCAAAYSYSCETEASLPSLSWRRKGSRGFGSRLRDWEWVCLAGLLLWNDLSSPASICSAHNWPSPAPPVSMGAGVEEGATGASAPGVSSAGASMTGVSATAASATGASGVSTTGVSAIGAAVAPALGLLELGIWASYFICDSWRDSLGATWGHLGKGAPVRCRHS